MEKKLRVIAVIAAAIFLVCAVGFIFVPTIIAQSVFKSNFGERYTTYEPLSWESSDFDGLMVKEYAFTSDKGQKLAGYNYFKNGDGFKGIVVMAHGYGGGGHNYYMNVADHFASNGYTVFAYDATGNDASEGDGIGGLPQGIIDLDYAIRFVKEREEFKGLPIMLFGHSWGGYSVGSVLELHPDVSAAITVAAFNSSADMLELEGRKVAGDAIAIMMPTLNGYDEKLFGKYAQLSVMRGFEATTADIMVLHSVDDAVIPIEQSYDVFYEEYKDEPRFTFIRYENRGHDNVYNDESIFEYKKAFNAAAAEFNANYDGDMTEEVRAEYFRENVDMHQLYALDDELMNKMVAHFDNSID